MEIGYVDEIKRGKISGWAADTTYPNEKVDVLIYIDTKRIARMTCDRMREDLREAGYGDGKHGFKYELNTEPEARITVRFANSLRLVRDGAGFFKEGLDSAVRVQSPSKYKVNAPRNLRTLLALFTLYDEEEGLDELLSRVDFGDDWSAQWLIDSDPEVYLEGSERSNTGQILTLTRLYNFLLSKSFQQNIVSSILNAFTEFQRIFFIHIPKCAGTDLMSHLVERYPLIDPFWASELWTSQDELFRALAILNRELLFSQAVLVAGHVPLASYIEMDLLRPSDRVVSIVRHPIDIALSQVNYVMSRFELNLHALAYDRDVKEWLSLLGLPSLPDKMTQSVISNLTRRILRSPSIVRPNSICYYLGGDDLRTTKERLARYRVELTTTTRYNDWLASKWGIKTPLRENISSMYISFQSLDPHDQEYLVNLSSQDEELYNCISSKVSLQDRPSVFGEDLL